MYVHISIWTHFNIFNFNLASLPFNISNFNSIHSFDNATYDLCEHELLVAQDNVFGVQFCTLHDQLLLNICHIVNNQLYTTIDRYFGLFREIASFCTIQFLKLKTVIIYVSIPIQVCFWTFFQVRLYIRVSALYIE